MSIDYFIENIWKKITDIQIKERFYQPETDKKKRWNSFYDMQLIMATLYENIMGRETVLVTEEKRIRRHFKDANQQERSISLDEFESKWNEE